MDIRKFEINDLDAVVEIEKKAWASNSASVDMIKTRANVFPDGSIVAIKDNRIVGYAAAQLVNHISTGTWANQTDGGQIARTHSDEGKIAYGVNMSALPVAASESVAEHVIGHYYDIFIGSGRCELLCLGSRLPGYAKWIKNGNGSRLSEYLKPQDNGRVRDPELYLYQKHGFGVLWGLPEYFPDVSSANAGAMVYRKA